MRIATRGSPLALWQANHVAGRLSPRPVELVLVQTQGDRDQAASLAVIGGQGVFTKEVQRAVLDGRADVAVHSLKDLPTQPTPGLVLAAVPPRGPTADVMISRERVRFDDLPTGARVGTGSLRRRAQLLHRRPDLRLSDIRGNVDTRLARLDAGEFDAIILAEAGLERLGHGGRVTERLAWMVAAVSQGALGIECRADDAATRSALAELTDVASEAAVTAERALLYHLGGGCQVPLGASAVVNGGVLELTAVVLSIDGATRIADATTGGVSEAAEVGRTLAERLRRNGAAALVAG